MRDVSPVAKNVLVGINRFRAHVTIFSGTYAYQAVARYGDDVSFTSCPAVIAYPQEGPCVAALQQLLNADPPHAGIYHDGIFGRRRWPPPGNSSPATACRPTGEPTPGR